MPESLLTKEFPLGLTSLPTPYLVNLRLWLEVLGVLFTLESSVTRVSTNLYSNLNVEYMKSRVLMGKMVGKELDAKTIKWKLGLTWDEKVKNLFY